MATTKPKPTVRRNAANTAAKADKAQTPPETKDAGGAFESAVAFVLREEGGYVNHPNDPGGETNFGISKRAYPALDIKGLTVEDAKAIYRRDYWDKVQGDDLPPAIATAVFDAAVNQGASVAIRLLQRALGLPVDGVLGPNTLKAAQDADADALVADFISWRLRRYAFTNQAQTFMRGWAKRMLSLQGFILAGMPADDGESVA